VHFDFHRKVVALLRFGAGAASDAETNVKTSAAMSSAQWIEAADHAVEVFSGGGSSRYQASL
jgi:hypothetical protein